MNLSGFPRRTLAFLPTPLIEMKRLPAALRADGKAPRVFIKRDDQTGLALGGNKARKLEFLVGAALAEGCDTLITGGAAQSNHCRQTAAAAALCGLECHLMLGGQAPDMPGGNLLLDSLLGARIHWCGEHRKGEDIPALAEKLRAAGRKPYIIPYGGSSAVGALGFAAAVLELKTQLDESGIAPTRIVFASSSGGTHAGLMLGARAAGLSAEICGVSIDKAEEEGDFASRVLELANETARLVGAEGFSSKDVELRREFTGGGYGVVGELERRAIGLAAATEGILVDPVYTGRAFGGLVSLIESGEFGRDECVVFWHTGGAPALFAYAKDIV